GQVGRRNGEDRGRRGVTRGAYAAGGHGLPEPARITLAGLRARAVQLTGLALAVRVAGLRLQAVALFAGGGAAARTSAGTVHAHVLAGFGADILPGAARV